MSTYVYVVYIVSRGRCVIARYYKNDLLQPCSEVHQSVDDAMNAAAEQGIDIAACGDMWDIAADLKTWRKTR